jgi:hypothetical protein
MIGFTLLPEARRSRRFLGRGAGHPQAIPNQVATAERRSCERFVLRVSQLNEQGADADCIDPYLQGWWSWVGSGRAAEIAWMQFVDVPGFIRSPRVAVEKIAARR